MGLPPGRVQEAQGAPASRGAVGTAMSYWMKEPYYMSRWTYFHRPSVWNAVGGQRGLTWHGLYGFKTLFAGAGGVSYTGGPRTASATTRWILRGGGRGLEEIGRAFQGVGARGGYPAYAAARAGGYVGMFGRGFRTGGVAGGIRGLGGARAETAATFVSKLFGGYETNIGRLGLMDPTISGAISSSVYGTLAGRGITGIGPGGPTSLMMAGMEGTIGARIRSDVGIRHLLSRGARRRAGIDIVRGLPWEQRQLFYQTGRAGRSALRRGIMARGATRAMAGAAVGLNIALFGGMIAQAAYGGARLIGEAAYQARMNTRVPALEFGAGIDPFPQTGSLTERQRAITAISSSHLNARTAMGQEANIMHQ